MKLKDILTSDELKLVKSIKPVNNTIFVPRHIYAKIRKVESARKIRFKSIQCEKQSI